MTPQTILMTFVGLGTGFFVGWMLCNAFIVHPLRMNLLRAMRGWDDALDLLREITDRISGVTQ